jgi:hypothetical protein
MWILDAEDLPYASSLEQQIESAREQQARAYEGYLGWRDHLRSDLDFDRSEECLRKDFWWMENYAKAAGNHAGHADYLEGLTQPARLC